MNPHSPADKAATKHTPGPWKSIAMGGSSTVVAYSVPSRNDTRIPPYGYDEKLGYSVGYPFIGDDGRARLDFVSFSHADARLIAAAPDLLDQAEWNRKCRDVVDRLLAEAGFAEDSSARHNLAMMNFDAIANARGGG